MPVSSECIISVGNNSDFTDLRIDFTHHLRRVNFLRSKIQKQVTKAVNKRVPAMVSSMIYNELNPRLLTLKRKLQETEFLNLTNFDEQWTLQWVARNNFLRLSLKPKK
ncbi:hypothetical protein OESDEN_19195 [Oesophagostomum dentatum]|uniref:Uncharacterized protein n=1 Tax=Oesophagostomum dentatum TaxID=61180 RepID=A0A0B1S879_OESDE|nr:hypothetical protein OESDEN_19195 [Oesophagostomum dentatum]